MVDPLRGSIEMDVEGYKTLQPVWAELITVLTDHIDVKAANAKGIKVGHTPGVLSDAGGSPSPIKSDVAPPRKRPSENRMKTALPG